MDAERIQLQESISISVQPQYMPDQSNEDAQEFTFAYTVDITNHGDSEVKLLERHWIITDGYNKVREIEGEGVVGKQPNIRPGETFSYSSGAILSTKTGLMEGSYKMCTNDGLSFFAKIKPFALIHPKSLQ